MAEPSSVKCWSGCFGRSGAFLDGSVRNVTTGAAGAGRYEGVFLVLAVVLALVTVPLAGGRIGRLAEVRLRRAPLLFAALALQMVILVVVPGWDDVPLRAVHLGTYGMLFAFLWANRRIPGIWIVAAGGASNLIAIAANAGVMPAGPAAVRSAGLASNAEAFTNSRVLEHPRLLFLGDLWAIPRGWPLANVFSIGDVVIAIGVFAVVHALCGSRVARARSHDDAPVREFVEPTV